MENLQAYIRKILNESFVSESEEFSDEVTEYLGESKRPIRKVAGALIKDEESGEVLLIKRNDKTPKWAMVTGELDEGEDALDALEREMYEELFIRPGKVRLNFKGVDKFPIQNIELYYFEGFVKGKFKPHLDEENLDFGWFSMENLPSPLMNGTYARVNDITKNEMKYSDTKQISEARRQVRLIMEQKVMPKYYLKEAVNLLKEAEEKSPTFNWDFVRDDEKSPTYNWDLADKESGVKDQVSPTYQWDLNQDNPTLDSYDKAKQYIDKALSYIKDKTSAIEFVKDLKDYIKDLSSSTKLKLTKYVVTALLGVIGFGAMTSLLSNSSSEVEREAVKTIVANKVSKDKTATADQSIQKAQAYPINSSEGLIGHLKTSEGYNSTFYDIRDGAYTVGWGHAVFASSSKGSTGGDYPFVPKFNQITPDVTMLLSAEDMKIIKGLKDSEKEQKMSEIAELNAEQLLRDDIKIAEGKLNAILTDWESQGIEVKIDQDMYDAMISMIFNMGAGEKFRTSDFLQSVKRGDLEGAYNAIDKIDNPKLLTKYPGLRDRREKEKAMFGSSLASVNQTNNTNDISEIRKIIKQIINEII
jgi:GH24 family phage-related lysozyme (muramidase)/8-oxo-dGTP pyrophosphatase MutT (NUDIX family)